jgi:hypothetical protein
MKHKKLKELILDNYDVEIRQDGTRLWILMYEDQRKNICIDKWEDCKIYVSSGNESYLCECEDAVLYCLIKFIKDKHRWGNFNNNN